MTPSRSHRTDGAEPLDAVVVGAGFAGLYMLHRLRQQGMRARVIERAGGVGGTWYWNRYPGARCDVESVDYQFSFSRELLEEWVWTERYATQPEIQAYLEFVADRLDLRRDIQLETTVVAAEFENSTGLWTVRTDRGGSLRARFCIMAVGCLSEMKTPEVPGLDTFGGECYFSGRWPHVPVDFTGKRVGVIGTGSTAIQLIPRVAAQAERLFVFQRTPNYSMPAWNRPLPREELAEIVASYAERRRVAEWSDSGVPFPPPTKAAFDVSDAERQTMYEAGWRRGGINALSYAFTDFFRDERANLTAQEFARRKIREVVRDPRVADLLCPKHDIGTKRTCVDIGYFETYNRPNVELVDVSTRSIKAITPTGVVVNGRAIDLDVLVFATGFDAMTGALLAIDIRGPNGLTLRERWEEGPQTYLGVAVAGLPNLFLITGPQSPSVLSNMVVSIEQHVEWIGDCLSFMRDRGLSRIEASPQAEAAWVRSVEELGRETLYPRARSWYVGANVPGKPRVFMPYVGGCGRYRMQCESVAAEGYRGFLLDREERQPPGTAVPTVAGAPASSAKS